MGRVKTNEERLKKKISLEIKEKPLNQKWAHKTSYKFKPNKLAK